MTEDPNQPPLGRCLVFGASGYIGSHLVPRLYDATQGAVRVSGSVILYLQTVNPDIIFINIQGKVPFGAYRQTIFTVIPFSVMSLARANFITINRRIDLDIILRSGSPSISRS